MLFRMQRDLRSFEVESCAPASLAAIQHIQKLLICDPKILYQCQRPCQLQHDLTSTRLKSGIHRRDLLSALQNPKPLPARRSCHARRGHHMLYDACRTLCSAAPRQSQYAWQPHEMFSRFLMPFDSGYPLDIFSNLRFKKIYLCTI